MGGDLGEARGGGDPQRDGGLMFAMELLNGQGLSGNFGLADNDWTEACPLPCDRSLRVYCIEKAP